MLRPWEFFEYTYEEFILACRGYRDAEFELMKKFRLVGWAAQSPYLKNPIGPEAWFPLPDEQTGPSSQEEAIAFKKHLFDIGVLRNN